LAPPDPDGTLPDLGAYYRSSLSVLDPLTIPEPMSFGLSAYPNPFNPATSVHFEVTHAGWVSVRIFDLLGREVATLANGRMAAGSYAVTWNAGDQPSGTYFAVLAAGNTHLAHKLLLLK
jgi:hypothetical protein